MVCGSADGREVVVDGREVVVDGMLRQTAGKSLSYASELVVPEHLDAVQRHVLF